MTSVDYRNVGAYKKCTISQGTVDQSEVGTELPTSLPGTPQYTLTITESHLPLFTGDKPISWVNVLFTHVCGINSSGGDATVTAQLDINDVTLDTTTSASVPNGEYWNMQGMVLDISVGDVLKWYVYASTAGVYHSTNVTYLLPTRVIPDYNVFDLSTLSITGLPEDASITVGTNPDDYSPYGNRYVLGSNMVIDNTSMKFGARTFDEYGLYRLGSGDVNHSNIVYSYNTSVSNPYYRGNLTVSECEWRQLK